MCTVELFIEVSSFHGILIKKVISHCMCGAFVLVGDSQACDTYFMSKLILFQFLCDSITRCLDPPILKLRPSSPSAAVRTLPSPATASPSLGVTEVTSGLFLLGELWGAEVDTVHTHWVSCLFAAGLGDRGNEVCESSW